MEKDIEEIFSVKFLANVVLDLSDGMYDEYEFVERFGFSEKQAKEIYKIITEIRNYNKNGNI